ncbi:glycosyltransferase [Mycoplasmopsis lipofaciens]|uniref:glycosyltransferase n=1 Tax=Mycoplasmopsis lipofaciens TaxID=114884 RepID=UPI000485A29B|nr:glycosyltransferase [Mycoplasmopsis lipofaciens]
MKISIISPSINSSKNLSNLLEGLKIQNNQDFEVILVLSSASKKMYSILEKNLQFFGSRLKFIINDKRKSTQSDIVCAFHMVKASYVHIMFSNNTLRPYFVQELIKNLDEHKPDVFEFKPRLVGTFRWKPHARLESMKLYKKDKNPEFIAYSFPFIFNKIFKKSLISQFIKHKPKETTDTKFCLELTYFLLINAQTYVYDDRRIVREFISSTTWLNPINFIGEFKIIENFLNVNNIKLNQELDYARIYFLQIFLTSLLDSWKFRILGGFGVIKDRINYNEKRTEKFINDLYKYLEKAHNEEQLFFNTNIYIHKDNQETKKLIYLPPKSEWKDIINDL